MRKNVILVLLVLGVSVGLFGQFGETLNLFEPETNDARSEALGRTSILSSSGANFIFNNPAMLSNLEYKNVQFNGRAVLGKLNREGKVEYDGETETYESEYNKPLHMKLNGFAFGMPFIIPDNQDMKIGFGAGYRTYYDWGYNVNYEDEDGDYEWESKYHGGFSTLVLGGGISYQERFFGGISMSFPFLSNISSEYENSDDDEYETEGTLKGSFFTLSGSYILSENITFGLRLRTGYILEWEEEDDDGDDWEVDIIIPSEIGLAIEMKPNPGLKLYAEYLTRGLGDFEVDESGSNEIYGDSDNGFSLRTGFEVGEYNAFRGGFFMQSVPIYERESDDEYDYRNGEKPQIEMGFTTGFGVKINPNLSLDVFGAYSFLNYDESYEEYWGWEDEVQISNEYSYSKIKIGCSMGYNF